MSTPDWIALGIAAGPVDYAGDWAAGTTYKAGDVVRYGGVDYIAVNPSTGQTPSYVSASAVNGQFVKGVGGVAVWQPIIETDVRGLKVADSDWITMSLTSGSHYGAPYGPCRYRKLASGLVICVGLITIATAGATVFTFPVGYRPAQEASRDHIFQGAASIQAAESWRLDQAGSLRPIATYTAGVWVSMSNIAFYAG